MPDPRPAGPGRPRPTRTAVLIIDGAITPETVPVWCGRVTGLLDDPGVEVVTCDLSRVVDPDGVALEALARMQLAARRRGRSIRLVHVQPEMRALLRFAGFADVVPTLDSS